MVPLVGVIVPCFNQGSFAAECVESLHAQSWENWRAVVVDDASTDDSMERLRRLASPRVEVVSLERNLGRALVRNEAVRCLGPVDYVLNVDCDDRLTPDYIAPLVAALEADPRSGLAYGTLRFFGASHPSGESVWPGSSFVERRRYLENVIPGPGVMFRAAALAQTRGWRAEFTQTSGEDWDIWLQVFEAGWRLLWVRDAVYEYRQHAASFLARSNAANQIDVLLNLLRTHAPAIRRERQLAEFLAPQIIPGLVHAIRRGDARRTLGIGGPLLRHAPWTAMRLVAQHYGRRLRDILKR